MAQTVAVPDLTLQSDHKIVVANTPNDGDAIKLWYPPFYLDWNGFDDSDPLADGMVAMVAYRADNPFNYTQVHVPVETEAFIYSNVPSILEGLVITKTSDDAIAVSAGKVRFLSHDEWQEENVPSFARTVPSTAGSYYILAIDAIHHNTPHTAKIDMHSFGVIFGDAAHAQLLETSPYAAAVTQVSPALIIGRVDVDSNGKIIEIWNSGLHAGLLPQKISDFMEVVGITQHNMEVLLIDDFQSEKSPTTAEYFELNALPYQMLRFTINLGKHSAIAGQDVQYGRAIGKLTTKNSLGYELNGKIMRLTGTNTQSDSQINVMLYSLDPDFGNVYSYQKQHLYYVDSQRTADPNTFHKLGANEFCLHSLYVMQKHDEPDKITLILLRAQHVFSYKDSSLDSNNIPAVMPYMLTMAGGDIIKPSFIRDNAALCGFILVSDKSIKHVKEHDRSVMIGISGVSVIPATEGMSSIQDMPSTVDAPDVSLNGLAAVKTDKGIKPAGLFTAKDGSLYVKNNGHFTNIPSGINSFTQLSFTKKDATKDFGWNKHGAISAADLAAIKAALKIDVTLGGGDPDYFKLYGMFGLVAQSGNTYKLSPAARMLGEWLEMGLLGDAFDKAFGNGVTLDNVYNGLVHFNIRLTAAHPSFDYVNATDIDFNGIQTTEFLNSLFFYSNFYQTSYTSGRLSSLTSQGKYKAGMPYLELTTTGINFISATITDTGTEVGNDLTHPYMDIVSDLKDIGTRQRTDSGIFNRQYTAFNRMPTMMQLCANEEPFLLNPLPNKYTELGSYFDHTEINKDKLYYSATSTRKMFIASLLAPPRTKNLSQALPSDIKLLGYNTTNSADQNQLVIIDGSNSVAPLGQIRFKIPAGYLQYKLFKDVNIPLDVTIDYRVDIEIYSIN